MNRYISANLHRKVLGSYEYFEDRVAGKGTNSVVYQGKKITTNEPVCVKQINIRSSVSQRFANKEIELLKKINHPKVLNYITHFERSHHIFIITQMCQCNLLAKIKGAEKINELKGLKMFLEVLEGYQQLRNIGYIHRDIKPENILVKDGKIKLADFGYCTLLRRVSIKEPYNVGTPLYMAPETLSSNFYSEKSDIWSLGVTLHELLHKVTPFLSKSEEELKKQHRKPLKLHQGNKKILNIIASCLHTDVDRRYDLQKLMLQVKLLIVQMTEEEEQRQIEERNLKNQYICQNQLKYLRFFEYVKFLSIKAQNIPIKVQERIRYIFQHQLRMRIKFNQPLFANHGGSLPLRMTENFKKMQEDHQFDLNLPEDIEASDRLHFFNRNLRSFNTTLQWQTQAELKNLIKIILNQLSTCHSEQLVSLNEDKIKLVDFLLAAFVLNRLLIQKENDREYFAKMSGLNVILTAPSRVSLKVLNKIRRKALELQILP